MTRRFTPTATPPEAAEQLEAVFTHAPSGVALVSTDGAFVRTNPALERMLGRTGAELKRLRWQDLVRPEDLEAGREAADRARRGQPFDEVFRVRHAQGHELILRASGRSIAGPQGWFAVHYEDITDQVQEARRTQVLAAVAAGVSDAVVVVDREQHIVFVNDAAARLYGTTTEGLGGRPLEALRGEPAPPWRPGERVTETHRRVSGDTFVAEISPSPVCTPDGTQVGTAGVIRDVTARLAEQEAAAVMRGVFDAAAEGILGLDEHDDVRIFSPAAERIYGWRADEVIGQPGTNLVPEHLKQRAANLGSDLRRGETIQRESEALRKDGSVVPIMMTASPIYDEAGTYTGAAMTVLDVSDRHRDRLEMERARVLLHHVIEYAPGVISIKDADGRYLVMNQQGAALINRAPADVVGRTDFEFYPQADAEQSREEDERVIASGEALIVARDIALPDGTVRPFLITKFAIPGIEPGEVRVGVVATDVTELRRGQADRARLEALVQAAPDAIVTADPEGRIASWNPGAERMFGRTADEAIGQSLDILVPEHERARERTLRARVQGGELLTVRMGAVRADGSIFPSEASAAPLTGMDGAPLGMVVLVRDISELIEQELELRDRATQLERSNTDLERFAYAASHDLQEPLRSIGLAADALRRAVPDRLDADERELLEHISAAAENAGAQVSALLRLARVALGVEPQEPVPLDLPLADAMTALKAAIEEADAQIEAQRPLPPAAVPRAELALLFQNVLGNAINFRRADAPPRITITATIEGDCVVTRVADNGVGMTAEDRAHAFGIFGRGREDVPGTGMGLAVTQRMLRRRGGSIDARSEGPGKGSVFVIRLPAA
jgi:PAS domain S-box-containing protein